MLNKPILFLLTLAFTYSFLGSNTAYAGDCDCKPEFEVDAEGDGYCSASKYDASWCHIEFGTAGASRFIEEGSENFDFSKEMVYQAVIETNSLHPELWTDAFIENSLPILFAISLWDTDMAGEIPTLQELLIFHSSTILEHLNGASEPDVFTFDRYDFFVSEGCIKVVNGDFSILVKSPFADPSFPHCGQ